VELLFVALGGAILGLGAHYALPWRLERGVLVAPAAGVVVACLVWLGLTVLGWAWDGGWIWVVSLVLSGIVATVVAVVTGRARATSDEHMLVRLGG
jgi:quaternary ammonium compound-resistance protein SugE